MPVRHFSRCRSQISWHAGPRRRGPANCVAKRSRRQGLLMEDGCDEWRRVYLFSRLSLPQAQSAAAGGRSAGIFDVVINRDRMRSHKSRDLGGTRYLDIPRSSFSATHRLHFDSVDREAVIDGDPSTGWIRPAIAGAAGSRAPLASATRGRKWPFKPMIRRTESPDGSSL